MKLGEKIRTLRKEKNISQEMLAERLGVTFQAVSKWERDESYPDIIMLPAIANFFQVTVDTLLGMAETKEDEEVHKIEQQCIDCDIHYDLKKMQQLTENGLKKYPGNFRLMKWFVYAFQSTNPPKAIETGLYVLDHCKDDAIRINVKRCIIYAYKNSGNYEEAIKQAKTLPTYYDTSQDVLRACLSGREKLEHVQHVIIDLAYEFWYSIRQIEENYSAEEKILLFQKSNAIYDAIYETDDMPVKLTRKMRNFQGMAEVALSESDADSGLKYMEEAVNCAVKHDNLPNVVSSTSLLFNQHPYNRTCEKTMNVKAELLHDFETEDAYYKDIRSTQTYHVLIDKLK
jgi:transcriptional regulator with XRE-family HTH domain